ncbi:hypothetical protein NBRC116594_21910 [Shimia sp. NS0008-38b]|uniref:hypothetical protein n=1 Tax=Shimia sp. NS0008-38b TaxID=3127653 RepID=UPI0031068888
MALILYGPDYFLMDFDPGNPNSPPASSLIFQLLTMIATLWVAVAWHRFVLLEEYPNGVVPTFYGGRILAYFGYGVLLGLVVGLATVFVAILVGGALFWAPILAIAAVVVVAIAGSWAFYRLSPILPACAIGNKIGMKEAWAATKPLSGSILGAMVVFVGTIFALALLGAFIGGLIPMLGGVLILAINWLYILLGISFLTTLYGVAVEDRPID